MNWLSCSAVALRSASLSCLSFSIRSFILEIWTWSAVSNFRQCVVSCAGVALGGGILRIIAASSASCCERRSASTSNGSERFRDCVSRHQDHQDSWLSTFPIPEPFQWPIFPSECSQNSPNPIIERELS